MTTRRFWAKMQPLIARSTRFQVTWRQEMTKYGSFLETVVGVDSVLLWKSCGKNVEKMWIFVEKFGFLVDFLWIPCGFLWRSSDFWWISCGFLVDFCGEVVEKGEKRLISTGGAMILVSRW